MKTQKQKKQKCLHETCPDCEGTGQRKHGQGMCVHMISCPCPKCSPHQFGETTW